ncbi:sigma-70 family RNA polymerase sigma factor [Cellulomonas sp. P5_C5]
MEVELAIVNLSVTNVGVTAENERLVRRATFAAKPERQDVADVEQAVREELLRRLPTYRPGTGIPLDGFLWPYLLGAAQHVVRDHPNVRSKHGQRYAMAMGTSPDDLDPNGRLTVAAHDLEFDPRAGAAVRKFVATLPSTTRRVIWLHYYEGHTFAEVAAVLGISRQSVHVHHRRALAAGLSGLACLHKEVAA